MSNHNITVYRIVKRKNFASTVLLRLQAVSLSNEQKRISITGFYPGKKNFYSVVRMSGTPP